MPQTRGKLKVSPNAAMQRAIAQGWMKTTVEAEAFALAFSHKRVLTLRQHAVSVGGERWTCPELARWQKPKISVLVPKYEEWDRLPLLDDEDRLIGLASRQNAYHPLDRDGAREAAAVAKAHEEEILKLARNAPDLDLLVEREAWLKTTPAAPVAPIGATIVASDKARRILDAQKETPQHRREREQAERDARRRIEREAYQNLFGGKRAC
jgi:hypothetical protein